MSKILIPIELVKELREELPGTRAHPKFPESGFIWYRRTGEEIEFMAHTDAPRPAESDEVDYGYDGFVYPFGRR
jgi:hypothetical protein